MVLIQVAIGLELELTEHLLIPLGYHFVTKPLIAVERHESSYENCLWWC